MEEGNDQQSKRLKKDHQRLSVCGSSPSSGDEKLILKLKIIPKVQNVVVAEDPIGDKGNNQSRVCPECHKEFSNGKALGGHMRVHIQINKEMKPKKLKKRVLTNLENNTRCYICGKDFPSMKSLFGHLRCHPEREWRGVQPPAWAMNSSSSSVSNTIDSPRVDLMQCLRGWSKTAKRGSNAKSEDDEELRDAVNDLMRLARMESLESGLTHKEHVEETEVSNSNSPTKKAAIEESSLLKIDDLDGESDSKNSQGLLNCMSREGNDGTAASMKRRKKMRLMMDLETSVKDAVIVGTTTETTDKFKCSTCNKCFPSHQALGGHRASHNKLKVTIINALEDPSLEVERPIITKQNQGPAATYKCKVCDKTFLSGQALGGHKRCHWTTPAQAPPTRAQSAGEASQSGRRFLEIDLNELPTMEVDEEYHGGIESEHEAAQNGYVSSSGNSNIA